MHFSCATCFDEAKTCYICHTVKEKDDINFDEFTPELIKYEELFRERRDDVSLKVTKICHGVIDELKKFDECLDTLEFCLNDIKTCKNLIENSKTFETHYIVHRILSKLPKLDASTLCISKLDVDEINKKYKKMRCEKFNVILKERISKPDDGSLEIKLARQADRIPKLVAKSHISLSLDMFTKFKDINMTMSDRSNFLLDNVYAVDNIPFIYKYFITTNSLVTIFNKIDKFDMDKDFTGKNDERWLLFKKMFEV